MSSWLLDILVGDADSWTRDALCAEYPDVSFFVEKGESTAPAKRVCARCLVREECLDMALDAVDPLPGIWGGTSEQERRQMLKAQRSSAGTVTRST